MKFEVQKSQKLEDGRHEGKVIGVKYRTSPYKYTDYELASEGAIVKVGFPSTLYEDGKHATMLRGFGVLVAEGMLVEPEVMIGRDCEFITVTSGKFANVVPESLKPLSPFINEKLAFDVRKVGINDGQKQGRTQEPGTPQAAGTQPQATRQ